MNSFNGRMIAFGLAAAGFLSLAGCAPAVSGKRVSAATAGVMVAPDTSHDAYVVGYVPEKALDKPDACAQTPARTRATGDVYAAVLCANTRPLSFAYVNKSETSSDFNANSALDSRLKLVAREELAPVPAPVSQP